MKCVFTAIFMTAVDLNRNTDSISSLPKPTHRQGCHRNLPRHVLPAPFHMALPLHFDEQASGEPCSAKSTSDLGLLHIAYDSAAYVFVLAILAIQSISLPKLSLLRGFMELGQYWREDAKFMPDIRNKLWQFVVQCGDHH